MLCLAQAEERLSVEGFESRLEQVNQAPNQATLAAILADLEPSGAFPAPVLTQRYPAVPADHTDLAAPVSPAEYLRLSSVFASTKRAGSWTVPLQIEGKVLMGELTLDLRDAVFGSDVVDIVVDVLLGSFTLIVPAGTQVENEIEETLSSSTHSTRSVKATRPNGLLIRVSGRAILASVDVKEKYPTGTNRKNGGLFDRLLGSGD